MSRKCTCVYMSLCMCVFCTEPQEAIICHFKVLTHNPRSVDSFALETNRTSEGEGGERGERASETQTRDEKNSDRVQHKM